jgi:hypothetical protein
MMDRYESSIDRQIREAQERGEFDDLPGAGKPLPGHGEIYDENWWLRDLVRRENLTGVLPPTLTLRKELEDLPDTLAAKKSESAVRAVVADLNERVEKARRGLLTGPPVLVHRVDVEAAVREWRAAR